MAVDHTHRFTHRAENYARYRPGYPQEITACLAGAIGLTPAWVIADIGSGTGLLAKLWLANGNRVSAVEPNQEMREMAERLLADEPRFYSVAGTAEATTLPESSIDLVSAGSAFHWFDAEKAREEFRRILKPDGYALMAWNTRKPESSVFAAAFHEVLHEHGTNRQSADHRRRREEHLKEFFGETGYTLATFANSQTLEWEGLKGRVLSLSIAPLPGEPGHEPMIADLRRIFDAHNENGAIHFEYATQVFYGQIH